MPSLITLPTSRYCFLGSVREGHLNYERRNVKRIRKNVNIFGLKSIGYAFEPLAKRRVETNFCGGLWSSSSSRWRRHREPATLPDLGLEFTYQFQLSGSNSGPHLRSCVGTRADLSAGENLINDGSNHKTQQVLINKGGETDCR